MFTDSTCPDSTCKYRNRLGYCTVTVCVAVSKPVAIREQTKTPTIEAVPLDKLCEWLERYATMECYGCREAFGSCEDEENQEVSVCNSRERWKAMLTKWMEEQDAQKEN